MQTYGISLKDMGGTLKRDVRHKGDGVIREFKYTAFEMTLVDNNTKPLPGHPH